MPEPTKTIHWGRRIAGTLAVLILALLTAHAIWTSIVASRFSQRVAALRQAGEPVDLSDWPAPHIDPATNAGLDILAAAELINLNAQLPPMDGERERLKAIVKLYSAALERLEASRGKAGLEWEGPSPLAGWWLISLRRLQVLTTALSSQAILDHDRGNDAAAIDRLEQALTVGRFAEKGPLLRSYLTARSMDQPTVQRLSMIAPELHIGTGPGDAAPEAVRQMIGMLLDDAPVRLGFLKGLKGERALTIGALRSPAPPGASTGYSVMRYLYRPIMLSAGNGVMEYYEGLLAAAAEQSYAPAAAKLHKLNRDTAKMSQFERPYLPSFDGEIQMLYTSLTSRHLAGIALAMRWYAIDHDGRLPDTIEDLVPTYLPTVPADLFTVDLKPLIYKPDPVAPVVYSVGVFGGDDGGESPKDLVQPLHRLPTTNPQP